MKHQSNKMKVSDKVWKMFTRYAKENGFTEKITGQLGYKNELGSVMLLTKVIHERMIEVWEQKTGHRQLLF